MKNVQTIVYECLLWTLVLVWASVIAQFSAQNADLSSRLSYEVTDVAVALVKPGRDIDRSSAGYQRAHAYVRKAAHASEYLLMGILLWAAVAPFGISRVARFFLAFGLCVLYAGTDEFHQLFVAGRGAAARDVLIDSGGALIGCLVMEFIRWVFANVTSVSAPSRRKKGT